MIQDWLGGFLAILSESFPPHDWPAAGTDAWDVFFEDWRKAFARNGVSVAEAEEARSLLAENPPRFKADYIPKVVGAVKIARELAGPSATSGAMDDRETALAASKTCIYCFGDGLAIVYASNPGVERRIPETSAAYCICSYGRRVEATHCEKSPDVHKRIPDLTTVKADRSFWRIDPIWMTAAQGSRNRDPALAPPDCFRDDRPGADVAATIRGWIVSVAGGSQAPPPPPRARPDWMAPPPPDLPPPRPVPREARTPDPVPVVELTPEELEWF